MSKIVSIILLMMIVFGSMLIHGPEMKKNEDKSKVDAHKEPHRRPEDEEFISIDDDQTHSESQESHNSTNIQPLL